MSGIDLEMIKARLDAINENVKLLREIEEGTQAGRLRSSKQGCSGETLADLNRGHARCRESSHCRVEAQEA